MSPEEKAVFIAFIIAAKEVDAKTLPRLVDQAVALVTLHDDKTLIGTAAIKQPSALHRTRTFIKAGCDNQAASHPLELGWVHVHEDRRCQKHSYALVQEAMKSIGYHGVYATTKNDGMRDKVLPKYGFVRAGKDFPSTLEPTESLSLFTR